MKLSQANYTNWQAVVDKFQATAANVIAFYRVDTSISKVAEAWAMFNSGYPQCVYGDFGNQGPSTATFTGKYTGAVAVTTPIGVSES